MKTIIFVFVVVMLAIAGTSVNRKPIGLSAVDLKSELPTHYFTLVTDGFGKIASGDIGIFKNGEGFESTVANATPTPTLTLTSSSTYAITLPPTTTSPGKATR